jgi:putative DNA-invertase from lambdoid prophage Rac
MIRSGESLVVSRIDRLGRDALDIQKTVKELEGLGVRVHVVQLGGTDLTSSAGKMLLAMLAAFAEMERDLIVERTNAGWRARGRMERKSAVHEDDSKRPTNDTCAPETGESVSAVARA